MNRYPLWKYVTIVVALLIATLYTLPNFFGEAPAVQVSAGKASVRIDAGTVSRVEQALAAQNINASLRCSSKAIDQGPLRPPTPRSRPATRSTARSMPTRPTRPTWWR
jgi:hypothetical protein